MVCSVRSTDTGEVGQHAPQVFVRAIIASEQPPRSNEEKLENVIDSVAQLTTLLNGAVNH